jgi:hypothetical protein
MRYGSLAASAAVLFGLAACRANDAGMSDDLAKDLAAAKTSDALALAPHAGVQTVVSATELSPQARSRTAPSAKSARSVVHRTPHRDRVASTPSVAVTTVSAEATDNAPAPVVTAPVQTADASVAVSSPRPQPVEVSYPSTDPGPMRGGAGGVIGAIGGVILRGGVGDVDHCDPRARRNGGGGILINRRGPILRGTF